MLAGIPCPVCGNPVTSLTPNHGLGELGEATSCGDGDGPAEDGAQEWNGAHTDGEGLKGPQPLQDQVRANARLCFERAAEAERQRPAMEAALVALEASRATTTSTFAAEVESLKTSLDVSRREFESSVADQYRARAKAIECRRDGLVVSASQLRACGLACEKAAEDGLPAALTRAEECMEAMSGLTQPVGQLTAPVSCVDIVADLSGVATAVAAVQVLSAVEHTAKVARAQAEAIARNNALVDAAMACGRLTHVAKEDGPALEAFVAECVGRCSPVLHLPHIMRGFLTAIIERCPAPHPGFPLVTHVNGRIIASGVVAEILGGWKRMQDCGEPFDTCAMCELWCHAVHAVVWGGIRAGAAFYEAGGLDVLRVVMEASPAAEPVQVWGLQALREIATSLSITAPASVMHMFAVMEAHVASSNVQEVACDVLAAMVSIERFGGPNRQAVADASGISRVFVAMRAHPFSEPVAAAACQALRALLIDGATHTLIAEGLPCVLSAMDTFASSPRVVARVCAGLYRLTDTPERCPEICAAIVSLDGVRRILAAMNTHGLSDASVRQNGCGVLTNLAVNAPKARAQIVAEGGLQSMCSILQAPAGSFFYGIGAACQVLRNVARPPHMFTPTDMADVVRSVYVAMDAVRDQPYPLQLACYLLGNLATSAELAVSIVASGGLQRVNAAMDVVPDSAEVQGAACWALHNFALHAENRAIMAETGATQRLERAMAIYGEAIAVMGCKARGGDPPPSAS